MMFDIPIMANWTKIGEFGQAQTRCNTVRENAKRTGFNYQVGGRVLVRQDGILRKAKTRWTGPYNTTAVHTNGTIRIQRGALSEHLNIRRVKRYFE